MASTRNCYSPELRERAVRMLQEQRDEYKSEHAAINSITPKIGCTPDTLRTWMRQHERDTGSGDGGFTTSERQRLKELEREVRELRQVNQRPAIERGFYCPAKRWCILKGIAGTSFSP